MNQSHFTAVSILIGFALVAAALFFSGGISNFPLFAKYSSNDQNAVSTLPVREKNRHIYGDVNAPVTIVEFSDFECPFCSKLHPTLKKIVDESGGNINWEYRHLPLPIHKHAQIAAYISECVGKVAGNESFWNFTDTLFTNQKTLSEEFLTKAALDEGVRVQELESCVNDPATRQQVATDMQTARALGGSGTPFNVVIHSDGTLQTVSGALPYENWKSILNL